MPVQVSSGMYRVDQAPVVNYLGYQDVIEYLLAKGQASKPHELMRAAIKLCYESDLPQRPSMGHWKYYLSEFDLRFNATYTTGTITYDHTGGASERLLTFSTGLTGNPLTDLIYYRIRINSLNYDISKLLSSTTAQLSINNNPGADVNAGTSFTLYRARYPLPGDFMSMFPPINESQWQNVYYTPDEIKWLERSYWSTQAKPTVFTISSSQDVIGQMEIVFEDAPSADGAIQFLYQRMPRPIKYHGYEEDILATKVSGSAGANTMTLTSSTIAQSDWVGKLIRMYDTSKHPTSLWGEYPYKEQRVITDISGATLTLDSNLSNTYAAGTRYRITDPIDIRPTMNTALLRGCEYQLDILMNRDTGDENQTGSLGQYVRAVIMAEKQEMMVKRLQPSVVRNHEAEISTDQQPR